MHFSKAFDCLNHELLIAKFSAYGFSTSALRLIHSYLSERRQRVKINGSFSTWRETMIGVPQGSVLGPLLFNIYLNDLFMFVKDAQICNYADDTTIYACDSNIEGVMIYKIMNGLCPDNLRGRLVTRSQISSYQTRNQLDIDTPRQNLEFSKNSFFYSGAKTWNEIPLEIRTSSTITLFKRKLKEFLQN